MPGNPKNKLCPFGMMGTNIKCMSEMSTSTKPQPYKDDKTKKSKN